MFREMSTSPYCGGAYFVNPVLDGDYPDPAVLYDGGWYWLVVSTFEFYPGMTIFRSRDCVGWEYVQSPLRKYVGGAWAPNLCRVGDTYYIYFPANGTNFVITASAMDGIWSDPVDLHVTHIDPGHCVDDQGVRWLLLSGGRLVRLTPDGLHIDGEVITNIQFPPLPEAWQTEGQFPESPKIVREGGWYHLIYADGGTGGPGTSHSVMEARARSLMGPWEFSPYNPVVRTALESDRWQSKGHGEIFRGPDGWRILYHSYEKGYGNMGRKLLTEQVELTPDGWFRLAPTAGCDLPQPLPSSGWQPERPSVTDFFRYAGDSGWKQWKGWDECRLERSGGALRVAAKGAAPGDSAPWAFLSGDRYFEFSVNAAPDGDCEAGLLLFYDETHYNGMGLRNGTLVLYRAGSLFQTLPIAAEGLGLRLRRFRNVLSFFICEDGHDWRKLCYSINLASQDASAYGAFASLRPGIYACGSGAARFSDASYLSLTAK